MDESRPLAVTTGTGNNGQRALLIDGENVASSHAAAILGQRPTGFAIRRVYGDVAKLNGWGRVPELRLVHAAEGRNSADILLTVEAISFAHAGTRDFAIVTADGGLVHLVRQLREMGCRVVVMADDRATSALRTAAHAFVNLAADAADTALQPALPSPMHEATMERGIAAFVASFKDEGATVTSIGKFAREAYPECAEPQADVRQWLEWLRARPATFRLDPPGPTARVRVDR